MQTSLARSSLMNFCHYQEKSLFVSLSLPIDELGTITIVTVKIFCDDATKKFLSSASKSDSIAA